MRGIHRESQHESYDAIIIGAGIGGLSTAALLAKAGLSVLLVERHDRPGGYAHGFKRRRFQFDSGVHLVSGCGPLGYQNGSTIHRICQSVGIDSEKLFLPVQPYARAVYPELDVHWYSGEDAFVEGLAAHFPKEKANLTRLIRLCRELAEEAMIAEEAIAQAKTSRVSPTEALKHLFYYRRATLASALKEFIEDANLRGVLASLWPYMGLPPTKLSFLYWATMMAGYTYEGSFYCHGSFQAYAHALAEATEKLGGEVLLNASVRRIVVDEGRACGVILENGQRIHADRVVSNVDARLTADLLIGREHLPTGYWEGLMKMTDSPSVFVVYLATDLPLAQQNHAHETFYYRSLDHDLNHALAQEGRPTWFSATIPGLADPSLAPSDKHVLLLTTLTISNVSQSWRQAKPRFLNELLDMAGEHFPGLGEHILLLESGSPRTLERYTLNHGGAAYGFAPTPDQVGVNRPGVQGVLPGLYHTGHWTRPGGGIAGVSISAQLCAQAVLGIDRQAEFWERLGS